MALIPDLPLDVPELDSEQVAIPVPSLKRKMSAPPTPPITPEDPDGAQILERAISVLATEATALSFATRLYQTEPTAKSGLLNAVDAIVAANVAGGKLIICGVGKSGLVGMKTVATMKSLGVACSFMHAAEAMHGDLGDIRPNDVVLFITYSGRTQELRAAASHIDDDIPIIIMTSHLERGAFPLCEDRPDIILLPAPIHETEEKSFGVCAPTTSTTVAIAVGDMLALTAAERLYDTDVGPVFRKNHPGGAIGAARKKRKCTG